MSKDNSTLINGISLNDIYDFVDNGDPNDVPAGIAVYFVLMDKVRSLDLRVADYGTKESVLKHLMKVEHLSRHTAEKVYYDGLEYYYASAQLTNQAQKNVYAAKIERQIAIAEVAVKDVKDAKIIVDMYVKAAQMRGLDKDEEPIIPSEWLKKTWNLYTTDALEAGLEPINRIELGKQIDAYPEITNKEKALLKKEALVEDLIVFPDENPRKERK